MKVTVQVTYNHIIQGAPAECSHCPVALALEAAGFEKVMAGLSFLKGNKDDIRYGADTPKVFIDFMNAFDAGQHTDPVSAEVEFVAWYGASAFS